MAKRISITSRRGDDGQTNWSGGSRISKSSVCIQAIGDVDELNSWIGFARSLQTDEAIRSSLLAVQHDLFTVGSHLYGSKAAAGNEMPLTASLSRLDQEIQSLEAKLPPIHGFLLPAGPTAGAVLQVARSICRRAERSIALVEENTSASQRVLPYINRLSDALFLFARYVNFTQGFAEEKWNGTSEH
jgi:cob(I)alamin adenosyltransferase